MQLFNTRLQPTTCLFSPGKVQEENLAAVATIGFTVHACQLSPMKVLFEGCQDRHPGNHDEVQSEILVSWIHLAYEGRA